MSRPAKSSSASPSARPSPDADKEFNLAHILVSIPGSADEQQIAERVSRAQAVYERATNNEDFGQLAITYSDSGTALEGGALGWRKAGQLPSFVADIIPGSRPATSRNPSARRAACTCSRYWKSAAARRPRSSRRCTRATY
jgi:hypothetical protein